MDRAGNPVEGSYGRAALDRAAELLLSGRPEPARDLLKDLATPEWVAGARAEEVSRAVRLCIELGLSQQGLQMAEHRLALHPQPADLRFLAARLSVRRALDFAAERSEMLRGAENHLRALLLEAPGDAKANALYGLVLDRQGRFPEAIEAWRCAHVLAPAETEHRIGLAVALCSAGRFREAIPHFERVAQARPDRSESYINLGLALRESGEFEAALVAFERAADLRPSSARIQTDLGITFRALGRLEAALEAFDRSIERSPGDAEPWHQKGRALLRAGRLEEAARALEEARTRKPHDRSIQRALLELARVPAKEDEDTVAALAPLAPDLVADLSRFPLSELLEFCGMNKSTGLLQLGDGYLELFEGRFISGQAQGQLGFLERLIQAGVRIPPGLADFELGRGAGPLLETLLDQGLGEPSVLASLCFESSVEAVLALLDLDEGKAEFRSRPPGASGQDARLLELSIDAQGVLLEAFRRLDEERMVPDPPQDCPEAPEVTETDPAAAIEIMQPELE